MRAKNEIIAVNKQTGEARRYPSEYALAKELGCKAEVVHVSHRMNLSVRGWRIYGTPEGITKRIKELREQLEFVKTLKV